MLGWVVRWWQGTPLALAIDATALGPRVGVLAVRGVYRGCAIPVAWVVLPATIKPAWRRAGLRRLRRLRPAVPRPWTVIVLAARGWDAPWLLRRSVRLGWHPCLRIHPGGSFQPTGASCGRPLQPCAPRPGTRGRGTGRACTRTQVPCPLLARWAEGAKAPGLLLTALPPEAGEAGWYGRRAGSEQGWQRTKRAGWQWYRTRLTAPARAARRRWLAVAVATLWRRRVGGEADETMPASTWRDVTGMCPARTRRATRLRLVRVLRQGWVELWGARLRQEPLPQGRFVPAPWPTVPAWEDEVCAPALAIPEAA